MSMNKLSLMIAVAFALNAAAASASESVFWEKEAGKEGNKPGAGISASITWDEFRDRCTHPEQYDVQRAPQNIRIQCSDQSTEFVSAVPGNVELAGTRVVATTLLADKFHVAAGAQGIPVSAKGGSCLRFKEVEKTMTIERPMNCAEIVGLKGDIAEYCLSSLDAAKANNPKLIEVRETGRVIDTCGTLAQSDNGKSSGKDKK